MILETIFALFLVWLIRYVVEIYFKKRDMPPGPTPYPFIGNIPQMMCDPLFPLNKLATMYGDIFTVTLPFGDAVILNTAALVREARLERKDDVVGKLPESLYPVSEIMKNGLLTSDYSPLFQFRRKVFVSSLHIFGEGVQKASKRAQRSVSTAIEEIDSKSQRRFAPKEFFQSLIIVQLWEWMTSKKLPFDHQIVENILELLELLSKPYLSNLYHLFPFVSYLPTQSRRDLQRAAQLRDEIFLPEFQFHLETYTDGLIRDLTDSFISAYKKAISKETKKDIGTIHDIPSLLFDITIAGSDTTSATLSWFLLYMVLYPLVQEKIQQELDFSVENEHTLCWQNAEQTPYLQASLCETLRKSGMITLVGTNAVRDTSVGGYRIPKGTYVGINWNMLHQDEREWPQPEQFIPERFLDSDGKFVGWNKLHGFLPFSVGRRECPGSSLGKIMIFTFASELLYRYKFELPKGVEVPSTAPAHPAITMCPEDFEVVAEKRHANSRN